MTSINILAGANSSGKSTIIQSILLLKQTVQYGAPERSIALNGPLLRMGEFNDIRNFDVENANVSIRFELKPDTEGEFGNWNRHGVRPYFGSELSEVNSLRLETEFGQFYLQDPSDGSIRHETSIKKSVFSATFDSSEDRQDQYIGLSSTERAFPSSYGVPFEAFKPDLDSVSKEQIGASRPRLSLEGASTRHFLPDYILLKFDAAAQKAAELATFICTNSASLLTKSGLGDEIVPIAVVAAVNEWLTKEKATPIEIHSSVKANEIRHRITPLLYGSTGPRGLNQIVRSDGSRASQAILKGILHEALLAEAEAQFTFDLDMPRVLRAGSDYVRQFFQQGVRYLGPLRDAPRPVYPLEALESTTDVGYRGEHTAAVFQLNSHSNISYHLPPNEDFDTDYFSYADDERGSLHDAAVHWLGYLGVADEVKSTDSGVFGNRLQVATGNTDRWHDLTNVGVGVSQVLPLVVTALLAPKGSLLIFEQPELHLHPRVQARLADFFIALSLDGKQMLLETHSEYMIDRLRLRIALSDRDDVRQMVNILFTEKNGPESKITSVEVSEYGAISNWPKDFFDQSQKDVARLLKAAAQKRSKKSRVK